MEQAIASLCAVIARHGRLCPGTVAGADDVENALLAVRGALGPVPDLLWDRAVDDARAARADLAALDPSLRLAVAPEVVLYDPVEQRRGYLAQLESLQAPEVILEQTRAVLAELEAAAPPFTPAWDQVFVLRDRLADWPGYRRDCELAIRVAARVLGAWRRAHPTDDRPARLLDDAAEALRAGAHARLGALRDELSARTYQVAGPANSSLRAAIGAHDRVTQNPHRDDQTDVEHHGELAWDEAGPRFVDWWIDEIARVG